MVDLGWNQVGINLRKRGPSDGMETIFAGSKDLVRGWDMGKGEAVLAGSKEGRRWETIGKGPGKGHTERNRE